MSRPYSVRVASVLHTRSPRQMHVKLTPHSNRIHGHDYLSVPVNIHRYYICAASVLCRCHILAISVCEFMQGYATGMIRIRQWQHGCRADMRRRRYRFDTDICCVSYLDCLKIIDTDKFGLGDHGGHDTDVIRIWTGQQGHDDGHLSMSRACVNPCV